MSEEATQFKDTVVAEVVKQTKKSAFALMIGLAVLQIAVYISKAKEL